MKGDLHMLHKIRQTVNFLESKLSEPPRVGMITGTGLGSLTEGMEVVFRIGYEEIPNFPKASVEGHKGTLVSGKLAGRPMIAMEGRSHLYEGYSPKEITFPIRVMAMLGVRYLFKSSAVGGLNTQFATGDLVIVTDHINLTGANPLMGPNLDAFGPRFPDMTQVYDPDLIVLAREKALELGILIRQGVYVGISGPSLETPAETRFLRMVGADVVGMSTVSETIVGVHCGLKILAIVVITNMNLPDCMKETSIEEVISNAQKAGPTLSRLWERIVAGLKD
jgi:purine-nucleoside phosphorylase